MLCEIGKAHGKTAAQVALKWNVQRGVPVIPRSENTAHRAENLELDFTLTDEQMQKISALGIGHSEIIDHRCAHTARQLINYTIDDKRRDSI